MEELKVVITLKGSRGSLGIQAPDCDPVFVTLEGDLGAALGRVPPLVEEARQRWENSPKYPKHERPTPPPTSPLPQERPAPRPSTPSTPQPRMF